MCGRTATVATYRQYYESFHVLGNPPEGGLENYNFGPSNYRRKNDVDSIEWQYLPIIRIINGERKFDLLIWKLIPNWAKGILPNYPTANCRAEKTEPFSTTMSKKPAFRNAWKHDQRCLIPVSWFYEWNQHTKPKQPSLIRDINEPFLVFAGLWDCSIAQDGTTLTSTTIITTHANELLEKVGHHRSPVMLESQDYDCWLNGSKNQAEELLAPYRSDTLEALTMPLAVNDPSYTHPELLRDNKIN